MVDYDPYSEEIQRDPYPTYRRLRAESPVHYLEKFDAWALSLFEDIWEASQDGERYSIRHGNAGEHLLHRAPPMMVTLATLDDPLHNDLRKAVFPIFGPAHARELEAEIRGDARACIARFIDTGRCDAVVDLSGEVAVKVACRLNGFPLSDATMLMNLTRRFFSREPGVDGMPADSHAAKEEMWAYLDDFVREREREPVGRRDTTDILRSLRPGGKALSTEEISRHLVLMLIGAADTFPKVFASGLVRLWEHPDQRRELREDPTLTMDALTEILRYDMPTQWLGRIATKDHEVRGKKIQAGQVVLFLYPSANRDEREFVDPDRFDIHRRAPRILSFGQGIHRCLGAHFARLEGKILLEEMLIHFPEYEVRMDEAVREPTEFVQGYNVLPIEFAPRSSSNLDPA